MSPIARTPNLFLVGAGPVAGAVAGALRRSGVPVLGLWGRRPEAAREAGALAGVAAFSPELPELIRQADIVIVAVRDDAIPEVAARLVDGGLVGEGQVLLQCCGARAAADSFAGVAGRVAGIGTVHPLSAIVDPVKAARSLRGTVFGVEGDEQGHARALELVGLLGGRAIELKPETMALYHAGAAMASNFMVALIDAAAVALAAAGVEGDALLALLPLAEGTLDNLGRQGLPAALTGPIVRGDAGTVERHIDALRQRAPELLEVYRALGRRALAVARSRRAASEEALARVAEALEAGG